MLLKLLHTKLQTVDGATTSNGDTMTTTTIKEVVAGSEEPLMNDEDQSSNGDDFTMDESTSVSIESTSVNSSMTSEVDPGNLTLSDGRLDKEKMSSLNFPTANISRSLEKSFAKMKKGTRKTRDPSRVEVPISSRPAPVNTVTSHRRTSKRYADQKAKTDALLAELGL